MKSARIAVLAALGGAALAYGLASDGGLPTAKSAMAATTPAGSSLGRADNFMLVDQNLEAHELHRMTDASAIVLISQEDGCPISRAMSPVYKELQAKYAAQGVKFMMLNSSLQDNREAIQKEAQDYGFNMPILLDANQLVGEQLGVQRTAEVMIINPKTWQVVYHGPVDDRAEYGGGQKPVEHHFAADALDAVLAGKPAQQATMESKGCLIDFPAREQHAALKISYAKDVAPIIEKNCVACHEQGGIAPMALSNYAQVKGFSPMIKEVLLTHRMPPYNADPHIGQFSDSRNLAPQDIKTLVHWIEAGAPRGDGADPLAAKTHVAEEWPLGKPDLILDIPAYKIPASGVVDYQRPYVLNPLTEGKWLKASTVKVESRQGVHHVLTGYMPEVPKNGVASEMNWRGSVGGYAVGAESEVAPKDVGSYIPPGGAIGFQMHYTPFGKEVVDHTKIALYFYKENEKPKMVMHSIPIVNNLIEIPPGEARHMETAYIVFPKDALLYSAFPHAHYRGYSSDLWIQYPDGTMKELLALPRYDFNWQRDYTFKTPVKIPAGSKVIAHTVYDNSKTNPANPDPTIKVTWGEQSWQEMLYTALRYRWVDETSDKPVNYDQALNASRMLGMMDTNLDGKIEKSELRGQPGMMLAKYWDVLDTDHDGSLSVAELQKAQGMMGMGKRRVQNAEAEAFSSGSGQTPSK